MPQMKPDEAARIFATTAKTSAPVALRSTCAHPFTRFGMLSPRGRIAAVPKSTMMPMRFLFATGLVFLQSFANSGVILGAAAGTSLLLNVCIHPSTEPSLIFVVGPVIEVVHSEASGAIWK